MKESQGIRRITEKEREKLKKIGRQIQFFRKKKGISQEQLAAEIDCSTAVLGEYERGDKRVSIVRLGEIAEKLNVSISEILQEKNTSFFNHLDDKMKELEINFNINNRQKQEIEKLLLHTVEVMINYGSFKND